ncbi:hypothetical protein [Streptomyces sp. NPDC102476]|jgi:hypothetical protein|uniref:hypothetical protein n=1 Tax=Streptomyces sp. NPDC102476 TaxID=3366181 RepID=UPI003827DDE4
MALDIRTILSAVESHALASGHFAQVNGHEPMSPPTSGITAAVWVEQIGPARGGSGLRSSTARLVLFVRLYSSLVQQEPDAIDPDMMTGLDTLMAAYSGDFTLGDLVQEVDLLGIYGDPLSARAGYLAEGGSDYRVLTITLPLIVSDLWEQVA